MLKIFQPERGFCHLLPENFVVTARIVYAANIKIVLQGRA